MERQICPKSIMLLHAFYHISGGVFGIYLRKCEPVLHIVNTAMRQKQRETDTKYEAKRGSTVSGRRHVSLTEARTKSQLLTKAVLNPVESIKLRQMETVNSEKAPAGCEAKLSFQQCCQV